MKIFKKTYILFFLGMGILSGCKDMVANNIIKKINSPKGDYTAVAFLRDAGATTAFSPQVSILKKEKQLEDSCGNIFIGNNSNYIDVKWKDDETLLIVHDCEEEDIIKQEDKFKDIHIEYELNTTNEKQ